jgi:hypothetical protein
MRISNMKSFRDLKLIGLDTERSHAIAGGMVRIFFRLSEPPPLGWSYIFTTTWQSVVYPLKRPTGVDGDTIWIDCIPEEVGTYHLERLESAIEQSNKKHREAALLQAIHTSHQLEAEAQLRAKLQDMSQTLYPADASPPPRAILGQCISRKAVAVFFTKQETEDSYMSC